MDSAEEPHFFEFVHAQVIDYQRYDFSAFSKTGGFSAESVSMVLFHDVAGADCDGTTAWLQPSWCRGFRRPSVND
jgi:hypothetical protein